MSVYIRPVSVYVWTIRHPDGSAVVLGTKQPKPKDDGCYWFGPHDRFEPDGTVTHVGMRTTRYPSDVWVAELAQVRWVDES